MTQIDGRVYIDGHLTENLHDLQDAAEAPRRPETVIWIGLVKPGADTLEAVADVFGLYQRLVRPAHRCGPHPG